MNRKPIEEAKDNDIRMSLVALKRAAQEARLLAEKTGTTHFDKPNSSANSGAVSETPEKYSAKPE
jgi:hypothetical protein